MKSVTLETKCLEFDRVRLIDTRGLQDPNASVTQASLWEQLVTELMGDEFKLSTDGLNTIICPIMYSTGGRIDSSVVNTLYEVLMAFTIGQPKFSEGNLDKLPQFILVLNNLDIDAQAPEDSDNSDANQQQLKFKFAY